MHTSSLQAGVNLGGWISQYETYSLERFATFITEADIRQIAGWGLVDGQGQVVSDEIVRIASAR